MTLRDDIRALVREAIMDSTGTYADTPEYLADRVTDDIMERIALAGPPATAYGSAPPAARTADPETSKASAGSRGLRLDQVRPGHKSWTMLGIYGGGPYTDDQAALYTVPWDAQHNVVKAWARMGTELRRLGLIELTGSTVRGARLSRLTAEGRAHLARVRAEVG